MEILDPPLVVVLLLAVCHCYANFLSDGEYVEHSPGQIERCGSGTQYSRDGLIYSGKWDNDKMNGEGK